MPRSTSAAPSLSFFAFLLLVAALSDAARPLPNEAPEQSAVAVLGPKEPGVLEGCEGVGQDECLTKRALVAHLDYIYTQDDNKH